MDKSKAIRLDAGGGRVAAIAPYEMTEVLAEGKIIDVPLAPAHCRELLEWNGELLPVFDFALWRDSADAPPRPYLAIVAYQARPGAPVQRGCLRVARFPEMIEVRDADACALPDGGWRTVAVSCFREEDRAVPILSLASVFDGAAVPPSRMP